MTEKNLKKRTPTLWFAPLISAIVVGVIMRIVYGAVIGSQVTPQMREFGGGGMDATLNNSIWMLTISSAVGAAVMALVIVLIIRALRK